MAARRRPSQNLADSLIDKTDLSRMAEAVRRLTRILATALALVFSWLKLRGVEMPRVIAEPESLVIVRAALVLYYVSWVLAVMVDTRDEEDVFFATPTGGSIPRAAISIAVAVSVAFGILCWVQTFEDFVWALVAFWLLNLVAWRYFVRSLVTPIVSASRKISVQTGRRLLQARIDLMDEFLRGKWQWWRFGTGFAGLAILACLTFKPVTDSLTHTLTGITAAGFQAIAIAIFVIGMEGWIWVMRLRRRIGIRVLEHVDRHWPT